MFQSPHTSYTWPRQPYHHFLKYACYFQKYCTCISVPEASDHSYTFCFSSSLLQHKDIGINIYNCILFPCYFKCVPNSPQEQDYHKSLFHYCGPVLPNRACHHSLWEETGVPGLVTLFRFDYGYENDYDYENLISYILSLHRFESTVVFKNFV